MSIYDITLADPTDLNRPPERVLHLTAVGDLAFVSVEKYDEGNPTRTFEAVAQMTVSLPALREAIDALSHDRDREAARPKDARGEPMPDIGGARFTVAPL